MKKSLMICVLLFSCASYAMDDLELGNTHSPQPLYTQRIAIQYSTSLRGPKYGAKIETKGTSYVVKYVPQPEGNGFASLLFGSDNGTVTRTIESVIPGKNITLWRNDDASYDVIYRREDGVVVAEDLETGEALYQIKLERSQGSATEELLQSEQGVLQVIDKNGKATILSHRKYKNMPFHGCADKSDDDE